MKFTLSKAAKEAKVSKATLSEALKNGRLSAPKDERGRYQIDPAELFRVFPKTTLNEQEKPKPNGDFERPNNALEVEVKLLREQIDKIESMHERERTNLTDQIEALRVVNEEQRTDFRQTVAALTDQRDAAQAEAKRGFWARLVG